jgi:ABC-type amino acid transport substrate-binding protein
MFKSIVVVFLILYLPLVALAESFSIVGDDDFPPFSFTDKKNQIKGIDVGLMQEVGRELGVSFDITLVPWKRLLGLTENGDVFGSFALFNTAEREAFSLYTGPLHFSTHKLFIQKNNPIKYHHISDLFGKRIGIEAGFVVSDAFDTASKRGDIRVVETFNYEDTFRRLLKNGMDAFVGNELVVKYKLKHDYQDTKNIADIVALDRPIKESRAAFFVLSKRFPLKNKVEWQTKITQALKTMEANGFTQKVIDKYMN